MDYDWLMAHICDDICRWPRECQTQDELYEHCSRCECTDCLIHLKQERDTLARVLRCQCHPKSTKKSIKNRMNIEEMNFACPFCGGEKDATLFADKENNEYFVFCAKCGIETIKTYTTAIAAVEAFEAGKTEKIRRQKKQ